MRIVVRDMKRNLRFIGMTLGALVLLGVAINLGGCANSLFYYPSRTVYGSPAKHGIPYEPVAFTSRDGIKLSGWFLPAHDPKTRAADARNAKGTVIHFHGNSLNMTSYWTLVGWLPERGFNVFVFDYRGYGESDNRRPTQRGCFDDSQAALDYVRARPDVDASKLLLFGQSLGGNHAIAIVGAGNREGVRAIAVDGTFYSYPYIANQRVPGGGLLIGNRYSASKFVTALPPIPLLIMHGTADKTVAYSNATRLYEAARPPKRLITIANGGHIDALIAEKYGNRYRDELTAFFEDALKSELHP